MEKIWLSESYPAGVPHEIDEHKHTSLNELLLFYTQKFSANTAFINMGAKVSYLDLELQAKAFAAYLQHDLGLKKGDKFAIMLPNSLQYPVAMFGALLAGLVVVNVNPLYTPRELAHQLNDSEAKGILIIENFASTLEKVVASTGVKHVITTQLGDMHGIVKSKLINAVVKYVKKMVPAFNLPNAVAFNQVLKKGHLLNYLPVDISGDDLAFLQYTGGTTGPSKGAMLTHTNMVANCEQARVAIMPKMTVGKELVVTALPLYHIFALTANCLTFIVLGGTNLLITNPRDMPGFVKELAKYPFTALTGVNTLFNGLLNTKGFEKIDFSQLKLTIGGGMAVQRPVAAKWREMTNTSLLEGYGLTECAPLVCLCPYNQVDYDGSIGVPVSSTELSIRDDNGVELGLNEPGELWVKGPQVMKGYYNREDATAKVMIDGWFATGDVATVEEKGIVRIVDRKKDIIIVSGFNVFPNEIEDVVMEHSGVLEVAAVGVPHEVCGETVKVFIIKKDPQLTEAEIIRHCRESLTSYKVPKLIEFRDELPKTNVGKILRRELR